MSYEDQNQPPYNDPYYGYQPSSSNDPNTGGYEQQGYDNSSSQGYDQSQQQPQAQPQRTAPPLQQLQRVQSGIPGFDQIVGGGLIRDRVYLLAGPAGAGKTIFSTQFLYNGITKFGENGVYVVLEETPQQLRENMYNSFGWDLRQYEDSGNLIILDAISSRLGLSSQENYVVPRPFTLEALLYEIQTAIQRTQAQRVIIDSLDAMSLELTQVDLRSLIQRLTMILKSFGCTTLLVSGQADRQSPPARGEQKGGGGEVVEGLTRFQHTPKEITGGEIMLEENWAKGN